MAYPNEIDIYEEKLNKKSDYYILEEEVFPKNGLWEGFLKHDNAEVSSINIYSGSKLTGEKIRNYLVNIPSETDWKRYLKIYTNLPKVYITYQTRGDTVEAEDINRLQSSIVAIEMELDRHKNDLNVHIENRSIDGGSFI